MRMFSHSSTSARQPGGTTVVESNWSTIAGPSKDEARGQVVADVDRRVDRPVGLEERDRRGASAAPASRRSARDGASSALGVTPIARTLRR